MKKKLTDKDIELINSSTYKIESVLRKVDDMEHIVLLNTVRWHIITHLKKSIKKNEG